ncbi:hypothetical protein KSP40_PGU007920 [Platanthera guangdongensis]|uniref:Protein phosphatase 1 regulatory subunit 11 n=1 Tax=Platanthera guangdongensis TaxID=2320717 RepID=A0ABR2MJW8_9ASPA
MARSAPRPSSFSSGTVTLTLEGSASSSTYLSPPQTLVLRLNPPKKKVTWKEGTVDNEFLGRKSSKKCCIFHKQKPFDEDDSDEEDCHGPDCKHGHDGSYPFPGDDI